MKFKILLLLLYASFLHYDSAVAKKSDLNIVISEAKHTFRFIPSKDGHSLSKVEHNAEIYFRANRVADEAVMPIYYSDDIILEKVSGGSASYGSYFEQDVFFSDSKACLVRLSLPKAGAQSKLSYRRTYTRPEFFCKFMLVEPYDIETSSVTVEIPAPLSGRFSIEERNIPAENMSLVSETKGGKTILHYVFRNIDKPQLYSDGPSINITSPQLVVRGHFADEQELYRYLLSYISQDDPGEDLVAAKAHEIADTCVNDTEKISAICDFVHKYVRYIAVEHGEFGQKPDLASEVLRKSYGDCKGSASLLKSMLRSVGIDARLAWVGATGVSDRWTDMPNISSGNHMIAAVVLPDSLLFIDGTARHTPAGGLPYGIQGCQALVENGSDSCIVAEIPLLDAATNRRSEIIRMSIEPDYSVKADCKISVTGQINSSFVNLFSDVPPARRQEIYERVLESVLPGARCSEAECKSSDRVTEITGKIRKSGIVRKVGSDIYVDMNPYAELSSMTFDLEDRKVGGRLKSRHKFDCSMELALPENTSVSSLPPDVEMDTRWFTATLKTIHDEERNNIRRTFTILVHNTEIECADLSEYNDSIKKLGKSCSSQICLLTL